MALEPQELNVCATIPRNLRLSYSHFLPDSGEVQLLLPEFCQVRFAFVKVTSDSLCHDSKLAKELHSCQLVSESQSWIALNL